jgi:hypothetical protein
MFCDVPRFDMPWLLQVFNQFLQFFVGPLFVDRLLSRMKEQKLALSEVGLTSDLRLYALNSGWEKAIPITMAVVIASMVRLRC